MRSVAENEFWNTTVTYVVLKITFCYDSEFILTEVSNYSSVAGIYFLMGFSEPSFTYLEQVYKRLKLTLELVKKEMEISKLQVIHFLISQSLLSCFVQSS